MGVAACWGGDDDPEPTSDGDGPSSPTIATEAELGEIPLDGTEGSPITWRLPETSSTEERAALLTVRRYLAVDNLVGSVQDPTSLESIYRAVAAEDSLATRLPWVNGDAPTSGNGPSWMWLEAPQPLPNDELLVRSCRDYGWRKAPDTAKLPRPTGARATAYDFVLRKATVGGAARWVITRNYYEQLADEGIAFERACERWAQHTRADRDQAMAGR